MSALNTITIVGNAGQDITTSRTNSGQMVGNFSIATTEIYNTKDGQRQEKTTWHRVTVWGDSLITMLQTKLLKGKRMLITGQMKPQQ